MPEVRKTCPTCAHSWVDKYDKNECPKCLSPLHGGGEQAKRAPGEPVTNKQAAGSAMESESGQCSKGGAHTWKFGKCSKCGMGEGAFAASNQVGGECSKGGKHVFKFGKCTKCGEAESAGVSVGAKKKGPTKKELDEAFDVFDKDGSNSISPDELVGILTDPAGGNPLTLEQAEAFIARFDTNHDGVLDRDEFVQAVASDMSLLGIGKGGG